MSPVERIAASQVTRNEEVVNVSKDDWSHTEEKTGGSRGVYVEDIFPAKYWQNDAAKYEKGDMVMFEDKKWEIISPGVRKIVREQNGEHRIDNYGYTVSSYDYTLSRIEPDGKEVLSRAFQDEICLIRQPSHRVNGPARYDRNDWTVKERVFSKKNDDPCVWSYKYTLERVDLLRRKIKEDVWQEDLKV